MDKFVTKLQGIHDDLFDAAINSRINMYWCPSDDEGVDIVKVELVKTTDFDDVECEKWQRVKGSSVIRHQFGPFLIDVAIDDQWGMILSAIENEKCVSKVIKLHDDPIRFKDLQGNVYATYFNDPHNYVLPRLSELKIRSSELERYTNQLKRAKDLPKKDSIKDQRIMAYKSYIESTDQWHRLNEKSNGKNGFKDEVYKALKDKKAINGTDLLANKDVMKKSWETFKSTRKNKT